MAALFKKTSVTLAKAVGHREVPTQQAPAPAAANVARLRRDRLLANRGWKPGFANKKWA
jgi:hypothetical protein